MANFTSLVPLIDNANLTDLTLLTLGSITVPGNGTSVTYGNDLEKPGVTLVLTGTGIAGSPSNSWHITGIEAFDHGVPVWNITNLSGVDGTPATSGVSLVDPNSIFQHVAAGHAEAFLFAGNDAITTSSSGSEALFGFAGNDTITAGSGDAVLAGNGGHDSLVGGSGHDNFLFNSNPENSSNLAVISHFSVKRDHIDLSLFDFRKLPGIGELPHNAFHIGPDATNGHQRIIYNKGNGDLFYAPLGNGHGDHLFLFAQFTHPTHLPTLSEHNFDMIL